VHLSLDGQFLGVVAEGLLRPAAVAIRKDVAAVPELRGRISLVDKTGHTVAVLGVNDVADDVNNNRTAPSRWKPGVVTAPHGVAFADNGDLVGSEFNLFDACTASRLCRHGELITAAERPGLKTRPHEDYGRLAAASASCTRAPRRMAGRP
jgi:hypothetical protein